MKKSTIASLATFVVVMVLGVAYLTFSVVQYNPFRSYTTVNFRLDNASQIEDGTSVLLRGVKVGNVVSVTPADDQIALKVRFNDHYKIPADSQVKIEQLSAVGEPYLDFLPDSLDGPYLTNGATVSPAQVQNPLSIPAIFKLVAGFSSNINSKQLGGIADTVYEATSNTQGRCRI
ncbi:MlaD family protein [Tsukamurella soli]|uniref:MlaD family protein n=1 Tax=Tsukamurella soli TaxID=644556 RepID=UPI00360E05F6